VDHPVLGNEWMAWNLILALVPATLALALFRPERHRGPGWWIGAVVFVAFLPNAPYVLTDVVHLPADLRAASDSAAMTAAVLAAYAAFAAIGFAAYAFSVLRFLDYLRGQGAGPLGLVASELTIHALATTGIVLGRVFRFNSWDLLAQPAEVLGKIRVPQSERAILIAAALLLALAVGTAFFRLATGVVRRRAHSR
jgi:uncharacterized membrane protein